MTRRMTRFGLLLLALGHPCRCFPLVSTISQRQHPSTVRLWQSTSTLEKSDTTQATLELERPTTAIQQPTNNNNNAYDSPTSIATLSLDSSNADSLEVLVEQATFTSPAEEYRRGLLTIGFCTLVFASLSPASHAALSGSASCPVVLLNAAVSTVALLSLTLLGPFLEAMIPPPSTLQQDPDDAIDTIPDTNLIEPDSDGKGLLSTWTSMDVATHAGLELGLWKFLGTVANLYGLSMTTADHGAFLIQLTTLIVPVVQGIMGVPIPQRIQWAVALALAGVALFTQDVSGDVDSAVASTRLIGDALCVVAAGFYATYDLRLFKWGKLVGARQLITSKIATQAGLSVVLLAAVGRTETATFVQSLSLMEGGAQSAFLLGAIVLWSGVMVNALVPFLQVGGQQAIGPTRAQTLYASQPLWAAMMSYAFLGETVGPTGWVGGGAFMVALFLAATAEAPDPDCGVKNCEV